MNILVIDDHPLFIDGISQVLKRLAEEVSISKATSIQKAISYIESGKDFDLILLDLNLPELSGMSLLHRYRAEELAIPLVLVSSGEQVGLIKKCLDWGAMGFIPKFLDADEILTALGSVLEGNIFVPDSIRELINRIPANNRIHNLPELLQNNGISKKQYEVLELLAHGYSNLQIAESLHRTEHTVKSHVAALLQLLGVKNRTECIRVARERKLIPHTND